MATSHGTTTRPYNFRRTRTPQLGQRAPSTPSGDGRLKSEKDRVAQAGQGCMTLLPCCGPAQWAHPKRPKRTSRIGLDRPISFCGGPAEPPADAGRAARQAGQKFRHGTVMVESGEAAQCRRLCRMPSSRTHQVAGTASRGVAVAGGRRATTTLPAYNRRSQQEEHR